MKLLIVLMIILLSHGSDARSRRDRMNIANPSYEDDPEFLSELTRTLAKRSQIPDITHAQQSILVSLANNLTVIFERTNQTDMEKMVDLAKSTHYNFFMYVVIEGCGDKTPQYPGMDEEALRIQINRVGYNLTGIKISEYTDDNPVFQESASSGFHEGLEQCPRDVE